MKRNHKKYQIFIQFLKCRMDKRWKRRRKEQKKEDELEENDVKFHN